MTMRSPAVRFIVRLVIGGLIPVAGCQEPDKGYGPNQQPTPDEVLRMPTEWNVNAIAVFFNPLSSWIWTEDRSRVQGLFINSLYLLGHDGKGVFGDGVIRPRLFIVETAPDGQRKQTLFKEWTFDVDEAMPFRVKRPAALGWGYGLLPLDLEEADLSGRDIRVVISFERRDGRLVTHRGNYFRVPVGGR